MMTLEKETNYCLESNFIIDLLNGKSNAVELYKKIKGSPLATASVVLFEILRGEEKNTKKIDWQTSEGFKADVRAGIKDLLRKYGFKTKQVNEILPLIMKQTEFTFGETMVEA